MTCPSNPVKGSKKTSPLVSVLVWFMCASFLASCGDVGTSTSFNNLPGEDQNIEDVGGGEQDTPQNGAVDGIDLQGDHAVRESDGYTVELGSMQYFTNEGNDPYPRSSSDWQCNFKTYRDKLSVVYITSKDPIPQDRSNQCELDPSEVTAPHFVYKAVIVDSLRGMPARGETIEFIKEGKRQKFEPQVDDVVLASFAELRGVYILGARVFVAPPTEEPTASVNQSVMPSGRDPLLDFIDASNCATLEKDLLEAIEGFYFNRSDRCDQ
jgi:hypothetical protein